MNFGELQIVVDPKKDIQFWLDALNNPNINRETRELLNKALQLEINAYLMPQKFY